MEQEKFKQIIWDFFSKMMIPLDDLEIIKEDENIFKIKLKTNESSMTIWHFGKNLDAIRVVLKWILNKLNNENIILHLEVNDYVSKKEDKLFELVRKKIKILKEWTETILPYFNSFERKKIHSFINSLNDNSIFAKSIWEWEERRLHIFKKSKNITIDIDWIDI